MSIISLFLLFFDCVSLTTSIIQQMFSCKWSLTQLFPSTIFVQQVFLLITGRHQHECILPPQNETIIFLAHSIHTAYSTLSERNYYSLSLFFWYIDGLDVTFFVSSLEYFFVEIEVSILPFDLFRRGRLIRLTYSCKLDTSIIR